MNAAAASAPGPTADSVMDSVHSVNRIHDAAGPRTAGHESSGERTVPYHCPFCAEEDLRPHLAAPGAWHCRSCLRVFSVRFFGLDGVAELSAVRPTPSADSTGGT